MQDALRTISWLRFAERDSFWACRMYFHLCLSDVLLANHEKDDWIDGERTEDVVAFLDRLYTAKRTVDQRIVVLGGGEDAVELNGFYSFCTFLMVITRQILFLKLVPAPEYPSEMSLPTQRPCLTSWSSWTVGIVLC